MFALLYQKLCLNMKLEYELMLCSYYSFMVQAIDMLLYAAMMLVEASAFKS